MSKISFLVAIYKNEDNIIPFYEDFMTNIVPHIEQNNDDYELIMINDDSPDDSWKVMKGLALRNPHVKIIRLSRNFGALAATFTGMQYATGDCITVKACDLQEPAQLTLDMYDEWKKGEKVLLAVRKSRNDSLIGDFFSNFYYVIMRKMVDKNMPKGGFDVYLIDKEVKDHLIQMNEKNSPLPLQLLWLGYHPKEIYYTRLERSIGKSSWTFSKKMKMFIDSLIAFSYVPVRIMTVVGIIFLLGSVISAIIAIVAKLKGLVDVPGYTTLYVILFFSAGAIMFTLGILGEYIWRTLEASRNRPISVVEDVINFDDKVSGEI